MDFIIKQNTDSLISIDGEKSDWQRHVIDFRTIIRDKLKVEKCYYIARNSKGFYYGYIWLDRFDRNGRVSATLFTGRGVLKECREFISTMTSLAELYNNSSLDTAVISQMLLPLQNNLKQIVLPQVSPNESSQSTSLENKYSFRIYKDDTELIELLQKPYQPEYGDKYVFLIKEGDLGNSGSGIQQLNTPLRTILTIQSSVDTSAKPDKSVMFDGDDLEIQYSKQGFIKKKQIFSSNEYRNSNPYLVRNGDVISLKTASESGVVFNKEVVLCVVEDTPSQNPIQNASIWLKGRQINTDDNGDAKVLFEEGKQRIKVFHSDYDEKVVEFDVDAILHKYIIKLNKKMKKILFEGKNVRGAAEVPADEKMPNIIKGEIAVSKSTKTFFSKIYLMLFLLFGLVIVCAIGHYVWKAPSNTTNVDQDQPTQDNMTEQEKEEADLEYLNERNRITWSPEDLVSSKYKRFLSDELIKNITAVTEHSEIKNEEWRKCYTLIEKAREDSESTDSLKSAIKSAYNKGSGYSLITLEKNLKKITAPKTANSSSSERTRNNNNSKKQTATSATTNTSSNANTTNTSNNTTQSKKKASEVRKPGQTKASQALEE